jgi:RNA-binding protein YhbY
VPEEPQAFLTKQNAVARISMSTGRGRRIIERVMNQLEEKKLIKIELDFDGRTYQISPKDVELVIKVLNRQVTIESLEAGGE